VRGCSSNPITEGRKGGKTIRVGHWVFGSWKVMSASVRLPKLQILFLHQFVWWEIG